VLAAIALHDRMAGALKRGQGCWIGRARLAQECGNANISNVSTATTDLIQWGYVMRADHPDDKRRRVLHVVYDDADIAFVKRPDTLPTGNQPALDRLPNTGEIGCPRAKIDKAGNGVTHPNIFCEAEDILPKQEKYSPEGAPNGGHSGGEGGKIGAELARFERALKAGKIKTGDLQHWGDRLSQIHLDGDLDDPNAQRAGRLCDDVWDELQRRGAWR
jgi:hypothetical protein